MLFNYFDITQVSFGCSVFWFDKSTVDFGLKLVFGTNKSVVAWLPCNLIHERLIKQIGLPNLETELGIESRITDFQVPTLEYELLMN